MTDAPAPAPASPWEMNAAQATAALAQKTAEYRQRRHLPPVPLHRRPGTANNNAGTGGGTTWRNSRQTRLGATSSLPAAPHRCASFRTGRTGGGQRRLARHSDGNSRRGLKPKRAALFALRGRARWASREQQSAGNHRAIFARRGRWPALDAPSEGDGLLFKEAKERWLRDPAVRATYLAGDTATVRQLNNMNRVVALAAQDGQPASDQAKEILTGLGLL